MAVTVNIHEAKTQLSKLIAAVERGEEVIIANNGIPKVKLVLVEAKATTRELGKCAYPGFWIADDFDAPLEEWDLSTR
jgi:prevent-host-death family protein